MLRPFTLGTEYLPLGEVSTGKARALLDRVLKREVKRHELLHLKIERVGAVDPDNRQQQIRVKPSGSIGPRRAQLWTFADEARMATILGYSDTTPRMRACIWIGLSDEVVGGLVEYIDRRVPEIEADESNHIAAIKRDLPKHYLESLADVFRGVEDLLVIGIRFDGAGSDLMPTTWPTTPDPGCLMVDVTTPVLRTLFAWREYHARGEQT